MTKGKSTGKGITRRLFAYIVLVVLGISGLILLSNSLLLRPLYYYSLKNTMLQALNNISGVDFAADSGIWINELNSLTAGQPYDIVIRNGNELLYSSSVEFGLRPMPDRVIVGGESTQQEPRGAVTQQGTITAPNGGKPQNGQEGVRYFFTRNLNDLEPAGDGAFFGTISGISGIDMMVCTKDLGDGTSILLTQPAEPINQSIAQANILLAGCAALALAISLAFSFKISKRFTRPITQIQNTVGSIAALDFSKKCDIRTGDELQSLGEDVNVLADKLKNSLETLRIQNEQLEKDIAAQRQFISNASHELRTPLSLIKGYADEMNAILQGGASQKAAYIDIIAEEAAKMNRLLREMLELTRMESGMSKLQNERLSVSESIQTFLEKYDGFIGEHGLNISLRLEEGAIGSFDPLRFEQVLANYISNAARYGDEKKRIEIRTEKIKDSVRVSVFNTGRAIPEDISDSIWDGFFKADSARTREEDSYGLGLSIVKAIQHKAGQEFGTRNVPGGVVFWFDVAQYR